LLRTTAVISSDHCHQRLCTGRAGETSKGRGRYPCPSEPGDALRQL